MKTLLKLVTLSVAAAVAYKVYEQNKKKQEDAKVIVPIERKSSDLPELNIETKLDSGLIQSYKVQAKVMMDSYPSGKLIDLIHTVTFAEQEQLNRFVKTIQELSIDHEVNMDNLSINLKETIHTDVQEAFNHIIKIADMSSENSGLYHGWVFENLK